jgi:hypothetical protein
MLAGRQQEIHAERDRKLEQAWKQRQTRRRRLHRERSVVSNADPFTVTFERTLVLSA